jgi:Tfp pilus assembly protein FimV
MNPKMLRTGTLIAALFSGNAIAVGFGEIVLLSRIGEPLRAEVPILAAAGENVEAACFSLAGIRSSDLPVVSSARFRLNRSGSNLTLTITGIQPIAEPIFVIGLRAHCGIDLQRDYVLMPSPPMLLAEAETSAPTARATTASPTTRKTRNFREWTARRGDTLESIAEAESGGNLAEQRRLLTAMKRANPDLVEYEVLAEGRNVRIPQLSRKPAEAPSRPMAASRSTADEAPPPPPPKKQVAAKPKPAPPPVAAAAAGPDRIVLGAAPDDIRPEVKPSPAKASAGEVEERMLKLETTLNLLNQEVEKLNTALALTTAALSAQQQLMAAQGQIPAADTAAVRAAPPPPPAATSSGNWLELLLAAVIGGGMAAGLATFISRRNTRTSSDELSLAKVVYAAPPANGAAESLSLPPRPSASAEPEPAPPPVAAVDIPLDAGMVEDGRRNAVNVDFNDGNSALELAEIMLSFGRIRGAAETLAMHIEENAPDNIQPWTMLLDLYRRADMRTEFESLATTMRGRFNVSIPSWDESTAPVSGLKSLEDYAHIVWRITNSWGEQECMDYLYELVHDNRAGNRSGFPLEVIEEIALLMRTLEEGYGLRRRPA